MIADVLAVGSPQGAIARVERFWTWLLSELSPFPGRGAATLRMVIACLLIVTISMAIEIPQPYLSAFFVFFISKEDLVSTTLTGVVVALALAVGFGITIAAYLISVDYPPLRLVFMAVVFFTAMFVSRIFVLGPLAFGIGFVVLISQQFVDLHQEPEELIRSSLWSWIAMSFPIAIVLIINRLVLPQRPVDLLRQEAKRRLEFAMAALDSRLAGLPTQADTSFKTGAVDAARILGLLKMSADGNPAIKGRVPAYRAVISTLNRIVEAASILSAVRPGSDPPQVRARIAWLHAALEEMRDSLNSELRDFRMPSQPQLYLSTDAGPVAAILDEMERNVAEISRQLDTLSAANFAPLLPESPAVPRRLLVSDALSNPIYLQFSLKVTGAAMFCYILYTAIKWPGIHTCTITCAVIALGSAGATVHKASLRLSGALIGGGLAMLATIFVVPYLESIGGLLLLLLPVAALSGWIASGSERISYCGVQVAMAFFYGVLEGFVPSTDVTHVRDRVVGIIVGITVMAVVFTFIWPERAEQQLREALVNALRAAAALLRRFVGKDLGAKESSIADERSSIFEYLVRAQRMADVALFESHPNDVISPPWTTAQLVAATQATALSSLHVVELRASYPEQTAAIADAYRDLIARARWSRAILKSSQLPTIGAD